MNSIKILLISIKKNLIFFSEARIAKLNNDLKDSSISWITYTVIKKELNKEDKELEKLKKELEKLIMSNKDYTQSEEK